MKQIIYMLFIAIIIPINAQNNDDSSSIVITPYISEYTEIPHNAGTFLESKLNQILTKNGVSGGFNTRFIITPNITILGKEIVASSPPKFVYNFEMTLFVGDGYSGNKFTSETISLKGIGTNDTKAYINAVKNIKPKSVQFESLVTKAKSKIIDFYNQRCHVILAEATKQEAQGNIEAAIYNLNTIPSESSSCSKKSIPKINDLYTKFINQDCKEKYQKALNIWNANQTIEAANTVALVLSSVKPNSNCTTEITELGNKIASKIKEKDGREWKLTLLQQKSEDKIIDAVKAIGVAYGKNQPNNTYLISGWW